VADTMAGVMQLVIICHGLLDSSSQTPILELEWVELYEHVRGMTDFDAALFLIAGTCMVYSATAWAAIPVGAFVIGWKRINGTLELLLIRKCGPQVAGLVQPNTTLDGYPACVCVAKMVGAKDTNGANATTILLPTTCLAGKALPYTEQELVDASAAWEVDHGKIDDVSDVDVLSGGINTADVAITLVRRSSMSLFATAVRVLGIRRTCSLGAALRKVYAYIDAAITAANANGHARHLPWRNCAAVSGDQVFASCRFE
jgi:hypothetical protein